MKLRLVTPERVLLEEEIKSATIPTEAGEITVLPNHVTIVSNLTPGVVEVTYISGSVEDVAVSSGFVQVSDQGDVVILTETAETGEELDLNVIEEAKAKAEAVMKEKANTNDESFAHAAAMLEREIARYKAVNRYKQRKGIRTSSRH
ncbi:ATP synthase F1 subunit epsilon [Candidatus Uhrbacteria bacterium]|nr:ATP synthase F1 subunit epsilon [Candidatus Uhrbacteria bacterium]MBD3284208.1 ATP synthase F1 subunit epsilon [Candidatus Uhrbacteria bacterium]